MNIIKDLKTTKSNIGFVEKLLILSILFFSTPLFATTYYLSPSGNNSYSSAQAQNPATPWKTFTKAFGAMAGGDTLILLDGTYSDANGTGYMSYASAYGGDMPSGTSTNNMTTVRALNEGAVIVSSGTDGKGNYALFLGRSTKKLSYAKIQGIKFIGGGALYNTNHIYIKNCGFWAARQNGGDVFGIGTNDGSWGNTYNLIEDCWVWGKDRIIASNYMADYNVWRRVVVRGDGCNTSYCTGSGNPNVGFTVYNSQNVSVQNMIIVDRILGGGEWYANFASAQHSPGNSLGPAEWLGCISINSPDLGWYLEADSASPNAVKIVNSVSIGTVYDGIQVSLSSTGVIIENNTSMNSTNGANFCLTDFSSGTIRNLVAKTAGGYNYAISTFQPSYTDAYGGSSGAYSRYSPTTGARTTNPLADGTTPSIKYPVRIETGSALKGTGYGGADYGANVVYKYGTDGTFYGESGYNTLTANSLWPWPNEDKIKSDFASVTGGARGFAASGKQKNGIDNITLTSYIWEYLGNQMPTDIYGGSGGGNDNTPPSAPQGVEISVTN